ncbi:MAG: diguanylate cyclase [Lachnospiraceae bacterium]|nr:diguanylate cyclase [Lachnospiraceae bacterium]
MKSIQTKITSLIIIGIVVSSIIIGGVSILSFKYAMNKNSAEIMNITCSDKARELNNVFVRIEQSVEIMAKHAIDNLESVEKLSSDKEYLQEYTKLIEELGQTIVEETEGAVAVYIRFNPDIAGYKSGFFKIKNPDTDEFNNVELTDLSLYDEDDMEHVGWYYIPVSNGEPTWMQPYHNDNIDIYMISYVIPIYKDGTLIGIVGMDVDFDFITDKTDEIHIFDTGHAFLTDNNLCVLHSEHYEKGVSVRDFSDELKNAELSQIAYENSLYEHKHHGEDTKLAFQPLENDMYIVVAAPVDEINANTNALISELGIITVIIVLIFVCVAVFIANSIVKPLKELNSAAMEIAGGNLDVELSCASQDEVGTLTESFKYTAKELKSRIDYINNLAYIDALTQVKNSTAYAQEKNELLQKIEYGSISFAIFVVDINVLKITNDTLGHEVGNRLIKEVARCLVEVFDYEHVYRVGGDEFVVIMKDLSDMDCTEYERKFAQVLANSTLEIKPSAAIGSTVYDKKRDTGYEDVFKRADNNMYNNKQHMKNNI